MFKLHSTGTHSSDDITSWINGVMRDDAPNDGRHVGATHHPRPIAHAAYDAFLGITKFTPDWIRQQRVSKFGIRGALKIYIRIL